MLEKPQREVSTMLAFGRCRIAKDKMYIYKSYEWKHQLMAWEKANKPFKVICDRLGAQGLERLVASLIGGLYDEGILRKPNPPRTRPSRTRAAPPPSLNSLLDEALFINTEAISSIDSNLKQRLFVNKHFFTRRAGWNAVQLELACKYKDSIFWPGAPSYIRSTFRFCITMVGLEDHTGPEDGRFNHHDFFRYVVDPYA